MAKNGKKRNGPARNLRDPSMFHRAMRFISKKEKKEKSFELNGRSGDGERDLIKEGFSVSPLARIAGIMRLERMPLHPREKSRRGTSSPWKKYRRTIFSPPAIVYFRVHASYLPFLGPSPSQNFISWLVSMPSRSRMERSNFSQTLSGGGIETKVSRRGERRVEKDARNDVRPRLI